ncbi:hypothetical protein BSPWISOXPB_2825 [uncultured Gammaproteobacteria bacterium]|nr:hypothetical protein BSPWISOXPB_2825 [uncultured Gammaproteobacteria bacterium]
MVKSELIRHKKWLIDASISGVLINTIAVTSAFYSMQIYDRVVPTGCTTNFARINHWYTFYYWTRVGC